MKLAICKVEGGWLLILSQERTARPEMVKIGLLMEPRNSRGV